MDAHDPATHRSRRALRGVLTSGTASAATPECTIRGTDRSETLTGTAGRDVISWVMGSST
jgi:hypothetical protein